MNSTHPPMPQWLAGYIGRTIELHGRPVLYSVIYLRLGVGRRDPGYYFIQGRLTRLEPLFEDVFPILVTHMISSPDVAAYAQERGIALYYSYQF